VDLLISSSPRRATRAWPWPFFRISGVSILGDYLERDTAREAKRAPPFRYSARRARGRALPMPGVPRGDGQGRRARAQPGWYSLNQYKNRRIPRPTSAQPDRRFGARPGDGDPLRRGPRNLRHDHRSRPLPEEPEAGCESHRRASHRRPRHSGSTESPGPGPHGLLPPEEYDGILEIGDAEAYALNKRLFLEESLIADPALPWP